jgi:glycyl-tRNA synthetase alpha subunit
MNNNENFLKYQKMLNQVYKRKFKSFIGAEVDPESFEKIMDGDSVFNFFDVKFSYNVNDAVRQDEEITNLTKLANTLFKSMFNKNGFAWVNLNFVYDEDKY